MVITRSENFLPFHDELRDLLTTGPFGNYRQLPAPYHPRLVLQALPSLTPAGAIRRQDVSWTRRRLPLANKLCYSRRRSTTSSPAALAMPLIKVRTLCAWSVAREEAIAVFDHRADASPGRNHPTQMRRHILTTASVSRVFWPSTQPQTQQAGVWSLQPGDTTRAFLV